MIKVAFNSLPLSNDNQVRGVGFYTKSLLSALRSVSKLQIQEFSELSEVKEADIVHYPFFDLFQPTLPIRKVFPTIVTIHDVTPLVFPEYYPPGIKGFINKERQKFSLRNVGAVITDSKSSKDDINKYLGVKSNRIFSVYLAPAPHFHVIKDIRKKEEVRKKYNLPEKFVLYTGNVNWNKNLVNFTQSCVDLGLDLVLIGKSFDNRENINHPEMKNYKEFLEKFIHLPNIHTLGFVPDGDLVVIMNLAECLLLPSFYEGFGLTILEAQVCGTPVITGNVSSMPEVAGEGAVLVSPENIREISQALKDVMENNNLRKKLQLKGWENVKQYSWEKCAEETIAVYEKIIS